MIGYYVHHQGSGHLHRATAVAAELGLPVTGLSSLARPAGWVGPWLQLEPDDTGMVRQDTTASGHLHWVPIHDGGLRGRMAALSAWIERVRPQLLVADVSVEVALLARLHGIPVVSVVLPGDRSDPAHRLGFGVSTELVAVWPALAEGMVGGLTSHDDARLRTVGGLSRFPVRPPAPRRPGPRRVSVLLGDGGDQVGPATWQQAQTQAPQWEWTVLGRTSGTWVEDPYPILCDADVVVTHAGQNAVAEVAAARRPAIVVPGERPHREQVRTATVLEAGRWPVRVETHVPRLGWGDLLDEVAAFDGEAWASWTDGGAVHRFCGVLHDALASTTCARDVR